MCGSSAERRDWVRVWLMGRDVAAATADRLTPSSRPCDLAATTEDLAARSGNEDLDWSEDTTDSWTVCRGLRTLAAMSESVAAEARSADDGQGKADIGSVRPVVGGAAAAATGCGRRLGETAGARDTESALQSGSRRSSRQEEESVLPLDSLTHLTDCTSRSWLQ